MSKSDRHKAQPLKSHQQNGTKAGAKKLRSTDQKDNPGQKPIDHRTERPMSYFEGRMAELREQREAERQQREREAEFFRYRQAEHARGLLELRVGSPAEQVALLVLEEFPTALETGLQSLSLERQEALKGIKRTEVAKVLMLDRLSDELLERENMVKVGARAAANALTQAYEELTNPDFKVEDVNTADGSNDTVDSNVDELVTISDTEDYVDNAATETSDPSEDDDSAADNDVDKLVTA